MRLTVTISFYHFLDTDQEQPPLYTREYTPDTPCFVVPRNGEHVTLPNGKHYTITKVRHVYWRDGALQVNATIAEFPFK